MTARRRLGLAATLLAAVGLLAAGCVAGSGSTATGGSGGAATTTGAPAGSAACAFQATPAQPAPAGHDVGLPPRSAALQGVVTVVLRTNVGDIPLALPRSQAPCTVASFAFLAGKGFFDNTPCHRLTAYTAPAPLDVLQCGDPTGSGSGGPGYTVPDEKPTNLRPAPTTVPVPAGQTAPVIYPAGTIAMANSGQPNTGGSQFFLVYADTQLAPDYTVFGTIDPAGMQVLAKVAAGGIIPGQDPNTGQPSPQDGKPKLPVTIRATPTTG